ncbi:IMP dehydrogenase [Candidatus Gottesmanbacteria bacterium]|nr:IMP dehydrogenase [Candidatus Gottesmanbacteria bacterium]
MKTTDISLGLAYDDVLLVPQKSRITSRKLVSTKTKISRNIEIAIPFVSSNVDTVTESAMAIAMAKLGGMGIIHRFMTIEREVAEVTRVKRSEGFVMGTPFTLGPKQTVAEARVLMKAHQVSSAVIVDAKEKVLGLVSERDMWFLKDESARMGDLMTPATKLITAGTHITLDGARKLFRKHKVEKLPLLHRDGTLGGLITSRTVLNEDIYPHATQDTHGRLRVGAAVGVVGDYLERAAELVRVGVDAIVIDIAHIHSTHGLSAVKKLRSACRSVDVIAGNIATAQAARDLVRLDVDALKVGIGPGGICITRIVAGAGVPQLTALTNVAPVAHRAKIPMIADGGTNYPADMTKALAAGASTVMLTGWLAGTDESPGTIILRRGQKYKIHRGAASFTAVASRKLDAVSGQVRKELAEGELNEELEEIVPEGVETFVPYKGQVRDVIHQMTGSLRSGMSYSNAKTIQQLWKNAEFIRITSAGFRESTQHNVEEM